MPSLTMLAQSGQGAANAAAGIFALLPCCFVPFFFIIAIGGTAFWIWMLVDCASNEPSDSGSNDKIVWILIIVLTHWIGGLIYFLFRRPERKRLYGR